jgi:hypothetical protein
MSKKIENGTIYEPTGETIVRNPANGQLSILRQCKTCGTDFFSNLGNVRNGMGVTCSLKCAHIHKGNSLAVSCICKQCGKKFQELVSRIKDGKGKYCSKKCYSESMKVEKIPLICTYCGKTFWVHPCKKRQLEYGYVKHVFCSMKCTAEARKTGEVVKCENPACNNEFYRCAAYEGVRRFCSKRCAGDIICGENHHLFNPDKTHREGQEFTHKQRVKILNRYEWRCPVSGMHASEGLLEFHHIIPISKGGTSDPSNGIPLHPDVHKQVTWEGFDIAPYVRR